MKKATSSELLNRANEIEQKAAVKDREYSAAILDGKRADNLLQEIVTLRVEAEAVRRAAVEVEKAEEVEREKQQLETLRRALSVHENHKAKAEQEKAEGIRLMTEGIAHMAEATQHATAADNVRNQYSLAVPMITSKLLQIYQTELTHLYLILKKLNPDTLTTEERELLDALKSFL